LAIAYRFSTRYGNSLQLLSARLCLNTDLLRCLMKHPGRSRARAVFDERAPDPRCCGVGVKAAERGAEGPWSSQSRIQEVVMAWAEPRRHQSENLDTVCDCNAMVRCLIAAHGIFAGTDSNFRPRCPLPRGGCVRGSQKLPGWLGRDRHQSSCWHRTLCFVPSSSPGIGLGALRSWKAV